MKPENKTVEESAQEAKPTELSEQSLEGIAGGSIHSGINASVQAVSPARDVDGKAIKQTGVSA